MRSSPFFAAVAAAAVLAGPVAAQTVDVATPGTTSNCYAVGCLGFVNNHVQAIWGASNFSSLSGPLTINSISFLETMYGVPMTPTAGTYTFTLAVAPSISFVMADNLASSQLFWTGTLGSSTYQNALTIVGTPFTYDPALGSLVLDIALAPTGPDTYALTDFRYDGGDYGMMYDTGGGMGGYGLGSGMSVEFNTSVPVSTTPEPASIALVAGGLLALGAAARRRRTA